MQSVFSLTLLIASVLYTWVGYTTLEVMAAGIPGPGYFPLLIGIALTILTLWTFIKDVRQQRRLAASDGGTQRDPVYPQDVVWLIALFSAYIFLMPTLGMLMSTGIFMFLVLQVINRGAWLKNGVYAVLMPAGTYLLFEVFLKTGLPTGSVWA